MSNHHTQQHSPVARHPSNQPNNTSPRPTRPKYTFIDHQRMAEAGKQLFCGGIAGATAKTVTAPFSRLTILYQVHSLVTTKGHRPKFAMSLKGGLSKIVDRGGWKSLWRGNGTSVLHRFPYSAINFFIYENTLDALGGGVHAEEPAVETQRQLVRRVTHIISRDDDDEDDDDDDITLHSSSTPKSSSSESSTPAKHKFLAGAIAGSTACIACYPLDLVRTRLTTEFEGREHYRGIVDAFRKISAQEGWKGFYSGVGPTLLVAVPNFAISYSVYGTMKEYALDDELFYNLRKIDADSGEPKLGFLLTVLCGAASGSLATLITFPMDTIRRRMQIQNLHVKETERMTSRQQLVRLVTHEGTLSLYRGITPELLKVIPMVSTLFLTYEFMTDHLNVGPNKK